MAVGAFCWSGRGGVHPRRHVRSTPSKCSASSWWPIIGTRPCTTPAVLSRQASEAERELTVAATALRSALSELGSPSADANAVGEIAGWLGSQVAGLQRWQALAEVAGRLLPWAVGVGPLITSDESLAVRFPWSADATAAGRAAAQRLRAGFANGQIDADAVAELQRYGRDAHYSLAFAQEMGPEALGAVGTRLDVMRNELERSAMTLADPPAQRADLQTRSLAALEAVGTTFGTATRRTDALPGCPGEKPGPE